MVVGGAWWGLVVHGHTVCKMRVEFEEFPVIGLWIYGWHMESNSMVNAYNTNI